MRSMRLVSFSIPGKGEMTGFISISMRLILMEFLLLPLPSITKVVTISILRDPMERPGPMALTVMSLRMVIIARMR